MSTVLLTGFEPLGGDAVNPSGDAVRRVGASWRGPAELVVEVLPVTFAGAATRLRELITAHRPDVVIAVGLAGGSDRIRVERIAVNLADARIPDNAGARPIDEESVPGAPLAREATLPVKAIAAAVRAVDIPAEVSHSAGTFVCNHVFFTALDAVPSGVAAGFVHVPWADGQGPERSPGLPLDDIVRALEIAIDTALTTEISTPLVGGALD